MHSPLSMQDAAHLRDASGPSPVRTRSSTPLMMSSGAVRDAGGLHARTNLDAFAASRAGVEHVLDALAQSRLERDVVHRLHIQALSPADRSVTHGSDAVVT